jgi:hypothetical protein
LDLIIYPNLRQSVDPKEIRDKHKSLCKQLKNAKKSLEDKIESTHKKELLFRIYKAVKPDCGRGE